MRKIFRFTAALLLLSGLVSCTSRKQNPDEIVRRVKLEKPVTIPELSARTFQGVIREAGEVSLAFRVAGPIESFHVKEGDYVGEGQLVARIDPRDYEVQLAVAEAQYDQVKAEFDRLTELHQRRSVSDNDYEKAVAGEKMLRMQLQNATNQLHDTRLLAPFSGYIQSVNFQAGELVNTGMPVATMLDLTTQIVEVDLPAAFFMRRDHFQEFWCLHPTLADSLIPLQLAGYQMKANSNQLFQAKFIPDRAASHGLSPGMPVSVSISYRDDHEASIQVPLHAVFHAHGQTWVWLYDGSTSTVRMQQVETAGLPLSGMITIVSGLSDTDEVVVAGVQSLREGQQVEPMKAASETNVGGLL